MSFPIRSPSQRLPGPCNTPDIRVGTYYLWCILKVAARLRRFAAPADREKRNHRSSAAGCAYVFCTVLREMTSQCRGPNSLRPPRATRRPGWARCIAPLSCVVSICDLDSLQQSHAHALTPSGIIPLPNPRAAFACYTAYFCITSKASIDLRSKTGCQNGAELAIVDGPHTLSPALQLYPCIASNAAIHPRSKTGCQNGAELAIVDGPHTLSPALQLYPCIASNA